MNTAAFAPCFSSLIDSVTGLFGYECNVHPESFHASGLRQTTGPGFFSFERRVSDSVNCEYWGFGHYALVSRLRVHPKSA